MMKNSSFYLNTTISITFALGEEFQSVKTRIYLCNFLTKLALVSQPSMLVIANDSFLHYLHLSIE